MYLCLSVHTSVHALNFLRTIIRFTTYLPLVYHEHAIRTCSPCYHLSLFNLQLCFPSAASPQKVLVKPVNLTASFEVRGGNLTAIFSWDLSTVLRHQQLTGYQVTWAEVIPTNRHNNNKLPHSLISQSQILPPVSDVINYKCWVLFMFGYRLWWYNIWRTWFKDRVIVSWRSWPLYLCLGISDHNHNPAEKTNQWAAITHSRSITSKFGLESYS